MDEAVARSSDRLNQPRSLSETHSPIGHAGVVARRLDVRMEHSGFVPGTANAIRRATGLSLALRSGTIGSESGRCDAQLHPESTGKAMRGDGRPIGAGVRHRGEFVARGGACGRRLCGCVRRAERPGAGRGLQAGQRVRDDAQYRNGRVDRRARRCLSRHAAAAGQLLLVHPGQPARDVQRQPRAATARRAAGRRRDVRVRRQAAVVRIRCDGTVPVPDAVANARHVRRGDARCDDRRLDGRPVRVATGAGHGTRGRHHRRQGRVQEHDRRRLAIR